MSEIVKVFQVIGALAENEKAACARCARLLVPDEDGEYLTLRITTMNGISCDLDCYVCDRCDELHTCIDDDDGNKLDCDIGSRFC